MAFTVNVSDGKVTGNKATDVVENKNKKAETSKSKTQETKDMFMKLLVAEMKYQNPLEPTDNTEYVKEMASFSQVEALENVSDDMEQMHGTSLVGQIVTATDDEGNATTGKVEYTYKKDGETYLHLMDKDFKLSQVTGSQDSDYYTANTLLQTINEELANLPAANKLTKADTDKVYNLAKIYNAMSTYEQSFIPNSTVKTIEELVAAANKITGKDKAVDEKTDTDSTKKTDDAKTAETGKSDAAEAHKASDNTAAQAAQASESADNTKVSEETSDNNDETSDTVAEVNAVDTDSEK
ncbi:MAG: flagellar hook capping FlgD N-terminal domain-containing protein [Lachnospiraceae bacterium]|nr:flagellar hook capping FlgD N-terminal domain-containing protein [Lachnospiraceae bacterium]